MRLRTDFTNLVLAIRRHGGVKLSDSCDDILSVAELRPLIYDMYSSGGNAHLLSFAVLFALSMSDIADPIMDVLEDIYAVYSPNDIDYDKANY